jgi:hypothetical protein
VVVMPVVNDDEVLGVFELFSGRANAFGARDVSAVERLSEMVETAVRLAQATERLPERLKMAEVKEAEILEDQVLDGYAPEELVLDETVLEGAAEGDADAESSENIPTLSQNAREEAVKAIVPENDASAPQAVAPQSNAEPVAAPDVAPPTKKLFWSAAVNPALDAGKPEEPDQSHVPPVLRSLHKCAACGFPVSAGRALCVECEEKKWRGQLRVPKPVSPRQGAVVAITQPSLGATGAEAPKGNKDSIAALEVLRHPKAGSASSLGLASSPGSTSAAASAKGPALASGSGSSNGPVAVAPRTEVRAFAAAAQSTAGGAAMPSTQHTSASVAVADSSAAILAPPPLKGKESKEVASSSSTASGPAPGIAVRESAPPPSTAKIPSPEFVLSAGLKPSQSWLAANKYMIGVLLVVAAVVVAVLILH